MSFLDEIDAIADGKKRTTTPQGQTVGSGSGSFFDEIDAAAERGKAKQITPAPSPEQQQTTPVQPIDFYTTGKLDRLGYKAEEPLTTLAAARDMVKPTGVGYATRNKQMFLDDKQRKDLIDRIQQDIYDDVPVDPALLAQYHDYLDIPQAEIPKVQPGAAKLKQAKQEAQTTTATPVAPVSDLAERQRQFSINKAAQDAQMVALKAETTPGIAEIMLGESSTSGDVLRSAASMASGLGNIIPRTAKGLLDLPGLKQLVGNTATGKAVADYVEKLDGNKAELAQEIDRQAGGGVAGTVARLGQTAADMAVEALANVSLLGVGKVFAGGAGVKGHLIGAAKLAALGYAQTPGTQADKLKSAALMAAYALTPIPASKMPKDWQAKIVNAIENVAVSQGLSAISGDQTPWQERIPQTIIDAAFGASAVGKAGTAKIEALKTQMAAKDAERTKRVAAWNEAQNLPVAPEPVKPVEQPVPQTIEQPKAEVSNATTKGQVAENSVEQYPRTDAQRQTAETSGGNRSVGSGVEQTAQSKVAEVAPPVAAKVETKASEPVVKPTDKPVYPVAYNEKVGGLADSLGRPVDKDHNLIEVKPTREPTPAPAKATVAETAKGAEGMTPEDTAKHFGFTTIERGENGEFAGDKVVLPKDETSFKPFANDPFSGKDIKASDSINGAVQTAVHEGLHRYFTKYPGISRDAMQALQDAGSKNAFEDLINIATVHFFDSNATANLPPNVKTAIDLWTLTAAMDAGYVKEGSRYAFKPPSAAQKPAGATEGKPAEPPAVKPPVAETQPAKAPTGETQTLADRYTPKQKQQFAQETETRIKGMAGEPTPKQTQELPGIKPNAEISKGPGLKDSMGAASIGLPTVTVSTAEPGKSRLKGFLNTVIKSDVASEGVKKQLAKDEPTYEQQKTKVMKGKVLNWFTEDKSPAEVEARIKEAETFVRDPQEDLDTKGAVGVALMEHYRNMGNDTASVELERHLDPLMRGAGRLNQAASLLNQMTGNGWITSMNEYLTKQGVELPSDVRKQVETEFKLSAKMKDEKARQEALNKTIAKVASYVPFKAGEWLDAYRYTNMLSNPQSHERNIYGNLVQAFVTRPASLMANGNFSGTLKYLTHAWGSALSGKALRVSAESFNKDFSKWAETLETPSASVFEVIRREQGPQGKKKRIAWNTLTAIPKFLQAQDVFFGSLINAGETARLSGKGKSAEAIQGIAKRLEDEYLYRKPLGGKRDSSQSYIVDGLESLANMLETGRTIESPMVRWPMKIVVPFLRTPIRIVQFGVKSSPLAYLGGKFSLKKGDPFYEFHLTADAIAKAKYGKPFDKLNADEKFVTQEDLQGRRGLAAIGTMVSLAGLGMALTGNTTWGAPQDPEAKKSFYASGRRPYSFRVGGKWFPMAYLGPWFLAMSLPAAVRDAASDNPSLVDESYLKKIAVAAMGIPKIILSQTPMAGVGGLLETLQGKLDTSVSSVIGFQASQFVAGSGLVRWINKIVDPTYRKPVTIAETIEAGIPGLSQEVKAYKDENDIDAGRPWTDIYLPYTVGQENKPSDIAYKDKMETLKEKMRKRKEDSRANRRDNK